MNSKEIHVHVVPKNVNSSFGNENIFHSTCRYFSVEKMVLTRVLNCIHVWPCVYVSRAITAR